MAPTTPPPTARQNQESFPADAMTVFMTLKGIKCSVTRNRNALKEMYDLVKASPSVDGSNRISAKLDAYDATIDRYRVALSEIEELDPGYEDYWRTVSKNYTTSLMAEKDNALTLIAKIADDNKPRQTFTPDNDVLVKVDQQTRPEKLRYHCTPR